MTNNHSETEKWLKDYGLECTERNKPLSLQTGAVICLGIVVIAVVIEMLHFHYQNTYDLNYVTLILTVVTAFLGYREWISSKYESSIDKFYDRLDASNKKLMECTAAQRLIFPESQQTMFDEIMYVYGELDTLDYVIQKYTNGFMSPDQAYRGIRTFYARLLYNDFREHVKNHCLQNPGYGLHLVALVNKLMATIDEEGKSHIEQPAMGT